MAQYVEGLTFWEKARDSEYGEPRQVAHGLCRLLSDNAIKKMKANWNQLHTAVTYMKFKKVMLLIGQALNSTVSCCGGSTGADRLNDRSLRFWLPSLINNLSVRSSD